MTRQWPGSGGVNAGRVSTLAGAFPYDLTGLSDVVGCLVGDSCVK